MDAPRLPGRAGLVVATLAVGFVLLAVGLVAVLSQSAARRTGTNRVRVSAQLGALQAGQTLCQRAELVPAGTGAIRASLLPAPEGGGAVRVAVIAGGGATVASGAAPAGWSGESLSVPVRPVLARDTPARVCVTAAGDGVVGLAGEATDRGHAAVGTQALPGDVRFDYLRPRPASWWASAGDVIDRMGAGHPLGGATIAVLAALLLLASAGLASWQLVRGDP